MLPEKLIAKYPPAYRDEARLMVGHRKTGKIEHKTFKDLISYFSDGDTMVLNNTKVFRARLYGIKEKTAPRSRSFYFANWIANDTCGTY